MDALRLFHEKEGAVLDGDPSSLAVKHYGDVPAEYAALRDQVGIIDLSRRGRVCLLGADRTRLLNGQVTNDVKALQVGEGCYAALVTAKGRVESDLNIYALAEEILLDFEPGLTERIVARLEKYIIADDVEVVDVAPHYGLVSVQGPGARVVLEGLELAPPFPERAMGHRLVRKEAWGELYCVNLSRVPGGGFDLFVPMASLELVARELVTAARKANGRLCGGEALEMHRIEQGVPRFGRDMDETNLAPETGIESRAISYSKGCYIGQEVIARIRTYGQVKKALCGLRWTEDAKELPAKGAPLFFDGREVGYVTSALRSPRFKCPVALGYVRREQCEAGTTLWLTPAGGGASVTVVRLPFADAAVA